MDTIEIAANGESFRTDVAGPPEPVVVPTDATLKLYRDSNAVTELITFKDRGHSLVIDHGWRDVATEILVWLGQQGLQD